MRRLLFILLLTLLPIQASWAAICAYCPDQCIAESAPAKAAKAPSDDAAELVFDSDCNCCQPGGVGIATSLAASRVFPPPHNLALGDGNPFADSSQPDRPERPNWTRAA